MLATRLNELDVMAAHDLRRFLARAPGGRAMYLGGSIKLPAELFEEMKVAAG